MLDHQCDQVRVRDEVARRLRVPGDLAKSRPEAILLAGTLDVRQIEQGLNVLERVAA